MAAARRARREAPPEPRTIGDPGSEGALAVLLLKLARAGRRKGLVHVASGEASLDRLARILWALAPDIETLLLPPWDCVPFDRTSPSYRIMGLRVAALASLAAGVGRPTIVLTTAEGLLQRVPPRTVWADATMRLATGQAFDGEDLARDLRRTGYRPDDRVDEPGEFAIRGQVVDVFPAGYYLPVRIEHEDGRISGLASFEAATQRRTDPFERLDLRPASEAVTPRGAEGEAEAERPPGLEHRLADLYPDLETLLDYLPDAEVVLAADAGERCDAFLDQVRDAHETRTRFAGSKVRPPSPSRMYLDREGWETALAGRNVVSLVTGSDEAQRRVPLFAAAARPSQALAAFTAAEAGAGRRIVVTAPDDVALGRVSTRVERALGRRPEPIEGWDAIAAAAPGALLAARIDLDRGFVAAEDGVVAIAAADLLGSRARAGASPSGPALLGGEDEFRLGDAVIHLKHGVGVLQGIETIDAGPGGPSDMIRLGYAGGGTLMAPVAEIDLVWRYGSAGGKVALDRLDGESWPKRRAKVEREIDAAAAGLAEVAAARRAVAAPKLVPPRRDYERFVSRFAYPPTADQAEAVDAILSDLASGHLMDRLVCGDVGFGKTEVALRAAAAAALAGKQVAIVAPTTVLVRQHLQTFTRRFADLGIEVAHLSRLVRPAEAKEVKAGLADGSVRVVVGTHALAGKGVAFADLGLLVVDEEQRFGAADKMKLRTLGAAVHVLALSATPIPRTLQSALVGLQEVSVLATPPAERQPVRTVTTEVDDATIRDALLREHRRGGQSFVVSPRIEEIGAVAERLGRLVPELDVLLAHGKLPVEEIDETIVRFGEGHGDVLLATNIIESGLDVPRANTILVWGADRFGIGQLHQLRGRVGRGRERGAAYLLTEAGAAVPEATRKRLAALERHDRLGAGFAISAEDLDQRGAGDLFGETQAGHVKLIGAGLYRRLLTRALAAARDGASNEEWSPELNIGVAGRIPAEYVPEAETRLNLYARIARSADVAEEESLAEEIEDRFGAPPEPVGHLLALGRLKRLCRVRGIGRIDAGPDGIALSFNQRREAERFLDGTDRGPEAFAWRGERLVAERPTAEEDRLATIEALLSASAGA